MSVKNDSGSISLNQFSSENADFMLSYGDLDLIATKLGSLSCKSENGDVAIQLPDKFDSYGFNLHCTNMGKSLCLLQKKLLLSLKKDSF
ncbi:MAG: DUF4097 family beta strand repeat-containing protein [Mediterraneibacter gnavus]